MCTHSKWVNKQTTRNSVVFEQNFGSFPNAGQHKNAGLPLESG